MASTERYFELYRRSSVGLSLVKALDELITSGHLNPQVAIKVLQQFDKAAANVFSNALRTKATAKGHLAVYNLVEDVWTFVLKDAQFKLENDVLGPIPRVKIVACKSLTGGDPAAAATTSAK